MAISKKISKTLNKLLAKQCWDCFGTSLYHYSARIGISTGCVFCKDGKVRQSEIPHDSLKDKIKLYPNPCICGKPHIGVY